MRALHKIFVQCYTFLYCLRANKFDRLVNGIIEIKILQNIPTFLFQQSTQVADDVCRVLIVATNVAENRFDPLKVWRVCIEIKLTRLQHYSRSLLAAG